MKKGLFETISMEEVIRQDVDLENEEHIIAAKLYEEEVQKDRKHLKLKKEELVNE